MIGKTYRHHSGNAFVVLFVDDNGTEWGLACDVRKNEHGTRYIRGAFEQRDLFGGTCAGLARANPSWPLAKEA